MPPGPPDATFCIPGVWPATRPPHPSALVPVIPVPMHAWGLLRDAGGGFGRWVWHLQWRVPNSHRHGGQPAHVDTYDVHAFRVRMPGTPITRAHVLAVLKVCEHCCEPLVVKAPKTSHRIPSLGSRVAMRAANDAVHILPSTTIVAAFGDIVRHTGSILILRVFDS